MLKLSNLRKHFGDNVAVDELSLDIAPGEIFGLLGPNGAGKTTTVNMTVGLLRPDAGSVTINGEGSPEDPKVRAKIGVATQALAIYEEMTGLENVRFFARLQGLRGRDLNERADWAMEFAGLSDRRRDRASTYSGGMKRRLNLAIAVVHRPALLLLDEPTVGVDPQSRNSILEKIQELRDDGATVVYTTHYMEEAERLCDRVGIMDHGRMLALDTVDALIGKHGGDSRVIAHTNGQETEITTSDPLGELQRLKSQRAIDRFRVVWPDLETVFLNLTGRSLRD